MRPFIIGLGIVCLSLACGTTAFSDHPYILDPPKNNLRGHDDNGSDDLPESDCDPETLCVPGPKPGDPEVCHTHYKCVVHFMTDYKDLLAERDRLQKELIACQQTCHN